MHLGYVNKHISVKGVIRIIKHFPIDCSVLKGVLGESGEINAETQGILITHEIPENPYPSDIEQYFPSPFDVEEELKHRKDFRYFSHQNIVGSFIVLRKSYFYQ